MPGVLDGPVQRIRWTNEVAASRRTSPPATDDTVVLSVLSIDNRMLTTETAALVATVIDAVSKVPVAAVDVDGVNQPLRGPLGAGDGSDLITLALAPQRELNRTTIETFVDRQGSVPLLSCWEGGRGEILPEVLSTVVRRLQHRWPTVIMNLPFTCRPDTIAAAIGMSTHILLVADEHHRDHSWLYQPGHQLSQMAAEQRVTIATLGRSAQEHPADTISLPAAQHRHDARARLPIPTDPQSITMYERLLGRVYATESQQVPHNPT